MTRIETFAEKHRLKVTRVECHDQVIQGRRGHLYFDGPELCLMVLDGEPAIRSKWAGRQALDGRYKSTSQGLGELKLSVRHKQVEMALGGDVTMLIWLGKQLLGQKDKQKLMGDEKAPMAPAIINVHLVEAGTEPQ